MSIWDLIYPKVCLGCGGWGKYVCDKCQVGLMEEEQICPGCGLVSRYGLRHRGCKRKGSLMGLTCFWSYEGVVKKLIEEVKYEGYYDCLAELVGLSWALRDRDEFACLLRFLELEPVLVPVPLYKDRERKRGFNQAELIAKWLAARCWLPVNKYLLVRVRDTGQQVGRNREERLKAVEGAFGGGQKVGGGSAGGGVPKAAVLVDDVWTTGATMQEGAKTMRQLGVEQVWGLVLAR